MFVFICRLTFRLFSLITLMLVAWVGFGRVLQKNYPPILFGDTTGLQFFTMNIGCSSFWDSCSRSDRLLLEGAYTFPVTDWSPDGKYIAVHLNENWVIYPKDCLLVLKTCQPFTVTPALQDIRLAWGPGGTTLASYATTRVVTATIQTIGCWQGDSPCLERKIPLSDYYLLTEITWSGDGSRMAFSDLMQTGLVWLDTGCFDKPEGCGADLHTVTVGANRATWPSLSHDGRLAVVTVNTSSNSAVPQLFRVNLDSGDVRQLTFREGTAEFSDWSADERYILFSGFATHRSGDLELYLMDLERNITVSLMRHEGHDLAFANWGYAAP